MTNIDLRDDAVIRAGAHAVAHLRRRDCLVRGIDRFTHLPTRERAAMVWIDGRNGIDGLRCVAVALDDITLHPGSAS